MSYNCHGCGRLNTIDTLDPCVEVMAIRYREANASAVRMASLLASNEKILKAQEERISELEKENNYMSSTSQEERLKNLVAEVKRLSDVIRLNRVVFKTVLAEVKYGLNLAWEEEQSW